MKKKSAIAIILLATLALSSILLRLQVEAEIVIPTNYLTFPDSYMAGTEFSDVYDDEANGTISRTDVAGPGVSFNLSNFEGKIMIRDVYQCYIPGATNNDNLTGYSVFILYMTNVGIDTVDMHLFMNTGYTGGGWEYDTFWGGPWITVNSGETKLCMLNFSYAQTYGAADDPNASWRYTDGTWNPIHRLHEVTSIGIEFAHWGAGTIDTDVVASAFPSTELYVNPPTVNRVPANVSTDFTVSIVIENFTDFFAFTINMTWDSSLVSYVSAHWNTHLDALWGADLWANISTANNPGSFKLAAVSIDTEGASNTGSNILFNLTLHVEKSCNFDLQTAIHFEQADLSDQGAHAIPATVTDGMYYMGSTPPDLEFRIGAGSDPEPWEFCHTIDIEVWATHISLCTLQDYNITVAFNDDWLNLTDVTWGILGNNVSGNANYAIVAPGKVRVTDTGPPGTFTNGNTTLFTLTFHVNFTASAGRFWRSCGPQSYDIDFSFDYAQLSFLEGVIEEANIIIVEPLTITIALIRGDLALDGQVTLADISDAAYYFEQASFPDRCDLDCDNDVDIFDIVMIASNYGYNVP